MIMKRLLVLPIIILLCSLNAMAQSSMTDTQVMDYVMEQHTKGASQSQIVTQLMQRGVDISQIRRVKKTYERLQKKSGLGVEANETSLKSDKSDTRMRKANGDKKKQQNNNVSQYRVKDGNYKSTYDDNDEQYLQMQSELSTFMPDSTEILEKVENE